MFCDETCCGPTYGVMAYGIAHRRVNPFQTMMIARQEQNDNVVGDINRLREHFDATRRGKKGLLSSRDKKKCKARTLVGRGDKSLLCDPGSYYCRMEREKKAKIVHGVEKKKWKKNVRTQQHGYIL